MANGPRVRRSATITMYAGRADCGGSRCFHFGFLGPQVDRLETKGALVVLQKQSQWIRKMNPCTEVCVEEYYKRWSLLLKTQMKLGLTS